MLAWRYAWKEITGAGACGALATGLVGWGGGWWAVLPAAATIAILAFFRDPPRRCARTANILLAPADGVVRSVVHGEDGGLAVTIFLSVLNVHINRWPCAGRVVRIEDRAGGYRNALQNGATEQNAARRVVVEPTGALASAGEVEVVQIAGMLARGIVTDVRVGEAVEQGMRYGMIKLGSQTQVAVRDAAHWEVLVGRGQRVRAGGTPLLRWIDRTRDAQ